MAEFVLEDVHLFPEELLAGVYEFLGVEPSFRPPTSAEKIHSRSADTMPTRLATHLARNYRGEIEQLGTRFGGYAAFWAYCAERLAEDSSFGEDLPYPLWGSALREDWTGGSGPDPGRPRFQSGTLSFVWAAT